jgi:hypothetical protein
MAIDITLKMENLESLTVDELYLKFNELNEAMTKDYQSVSKQYGAEFALLNNAIKVKQNG